MPEHIYFQMYEPEKLRYIYNGTCRTCIRDKDSCVYGKLLYGHRPLDTYSRCDAYQMSIVKKIKFYNII